MSRKHVSARRRLGLEALEDRLCLSTLPVGTSTTVPDAATQAHLSAAYGQLPLSFEANQGQTDSRVNFLSRGAGYSLYLTPSKAVLSLKQGHTSNVVSMRVVGANLASHAVGLDKQAGVSNYFIGNDPSQWHTDIPNYAQAAYKGVYRRIDLVYHGDQQQLEYDFVVKPGASPGAIRLAFDGTQGKSLDVHGNLVLHTSGGDLVEHAPVAYQMINGVRHPVASRFVLKHDGEVGFAVGRYDHSRALVIDPVLSYSTYLAGSGSGGAGDSGFAIAVDAAGNAYVTGSTYSADFPTQNPWQPQAAGQSDAFVTKLNASGSSLVYSTYLGGSGNDSGLAIAIDPAGDAYVAGATASANFPTTTGAFQRINARGTNFGDAFVTELSPTGSTLVYSTFLGGNADDLATAVAVDGVGNAYVTGGTRSTDFPTTAGAFQRVLVGEESAFAAKINPTLAGPGSLVYSTYLGGSALYQGGDRGTGIAVDKVTGEAYVTGWTNSATFPTTPGAFQTTRSDLGGTAEAAFVTKFNATGTGLVYSTYLRGYADYTVQPPVDTAGTHGRGIALDGSGSAYVTGFTDAFKFPTTAGAFQTAAPRNGDAFVTKFNATGTGLVYSTYLGGSDLEYGNGIAVDGGGNAYVAGTTSSQNFPVSSAFQQKFGGGNRDAFVTKFNASGTGLVYSSYLGGSTSDSAEGIAVDAAGNAYLTGYTSGDFPTTTHAFQRRISRISTPPGAVPQTAAFVTKITAS
jgi:hypothetical protein